MGKTIVRVNRTNDDFGSRKKEIESTENKGTTKHRKSFSEFIDEIKNESFEDIFNFNETDIDIDEETLKKYITK